MPDHYADRVKETTTTTGTGSLNLAGAATGFQTFVAGIGNGNVCSYLIDDGAGNWEVGRGTVTSGSPDQLSRTTVLDSSNGGAAVNFGAGTKTVACVLAADDVAGDYQPTVQTFTSTGTWTKPDGCVAILVELVAGGAAGSGAQATSAGECSAGCGGGAGGFASELLDATSLTSETVTIGAGGTGVSGAAGNDGGTTSFGSLLSATGGNAGGLIAASTGWYMAVGGVGGDGSGGDHNGRGGEGGEAVAFGDEGAAYGGKGGWSPFGEGGVGKEASAAGSSPASSAYGAGGSGAANAGSQTAKAGGDGQGGFVRVTEFYF